MEKIIIIVILVELTWIAISAIKMRKNDSDKAKMLLSIAGFAILSVYLAYHACSKLAISEMLLLSLLYLVIKSGKRKKKKK